MRSIKTILPGLFGILLVSVAAGVPFQAAGSQILYYALEEAAGNTAADSSGNGLTGTWSGLTNLISVSAVGDCAPNTIGNTRSLVFAVPTAVRTAGGYVSTSNTAATRFTGPFTMMAWIKPTPLAAGQNHVDMSGIIFNATYVDTIGWNGYTMHRTLNGQIRFTIGTATTSHNLYSNGMAPNNAWTHVACVYTGTEKIIYLNGVPDITFASTLNPGVWAFPNLRIGLDDYDRNFYGNIDEVRLFNVALTAPQVALIHGGMPAPTGLTATPGPELVDLSWNPVAGATSYTVYMGTVNGGPYPTNAGTTTGTTLTVSNIYYPTPYYFVVVANGFINSPNSAQVSAVPDNVQPRYNDHEEGTKDDNCACGSTAAASPLWALGLGVILLAGFLIRRGI